MQPLKASAPLSRMIKLPSEVALPSDVRAVLPRLGKNRATPPCSPSVRLPQNREFIRVAVASRLMSSHFNKTGENIKGSSVCGCGRWKQYGSDPNLAEILVQDGHARMAGHFQCKAVWSCEHCAKGRVAQTRSWIRAALIPALDAARLSASLLTFTLSHSYGEDWGGVVDRLMHAYMLMDRRLSKHYKRAGSIGKLKALEAPVGENGLHPHLHILLTHRKDADLASLAEAVSEAWSKAISDVGASINGHGFDFKENCINDYVAKLETSHELASHGTKSARRKGKTLAQLLDRAALGDSESGDKWIRAQIALGGRMRFHAGGLPKKLGIICPSKWEDVEMDAKRDAEKADLPPSVYISYSQEDHMKATSSATNRAGLALILRSARSADRSKVLAIVKAICSEVDVQKTSEKWTKEYLWKILQDAKTRVLKREEVPVYLHAQRKNIRKMWQETS